MTKEITKAFIIQQIQDKFKLRDLYPEKFSFQESVVPIYDISQHLMTYTARYVEKSVTEIGGILFFEVPQNERIYLNGYTIVFMAEGGYTVTGLSIIRKKEINPYSFVYLDMTKNQSVSYTVNLPKTVILDSGDKLYINIDGYTSTQNLRLYIDYMREEIR